jgi:signal peptide peptidase SppA
MAKKSKSTADPIHPVHRLARQYLATSKWAIRQDMLDVIGSVLHLRSIGVDLSDEGRLQLAALRDARQARPTVPQLGVAMLTAQMSDDDVTAAVVGARRSATSVMGAVAVIPLCGVIDQKIGSMSDISGGTSVDGFMKQFRQCLHDPGVAGIVIDGDTPGGNVSGVPEAAAEILAARGTKPIVAVADPMIASAGYYLCCAADEIVCMPSGEVGSIGVLAIHDDFSEQNAMIGYKPTYIQYGAYKTELNPDTPLTPDALAYQQQQIDAIGNDFVRFVAKARGIPVDTVRSTFGQGRMLLAKDALAAKMIDRIETLDATIARVGRLAKQQAKPAAGAVAIAGMVPPNVSDELAPAETTWRMPTLGDFTDAPWKTLSATEQRRIAGHFGWTPAMPPDSFSDLALAHHRASDGKVVLAGVLAAAARLASMMDVSPADRLAVKAHLRHHWLAFGGLQQDVPESLQGALLEQLQQVMAAEIGDREFLPSDDVAIRFANLLRTLPPDRLAEMETQLARATSDVDGAVIVDALEQAAIKADAEALELTMALRSRT